MLYIYGIYKIVYIYIHIYIYIYICKYIIVFGTGIVPIEKAIDGGDDDDDDDDGDYDEVQQKV